jgi:hypothetical protein
MSDGRDPYADELPECFAHAIALSPEDQQRYLRDVQAQRPTLAARLEELLLADRDAGAFLERPFTAPGVSAVLSAGDVIEGFRIEENIASGANGSVYRATQAYPRRVVALKVLHFALPSPSAVARFRQEVRTLARLSHPGIVPLIAAGVIEPDSRALPWFAMELIDGARDIRAWARDQSIESRVRAIADACDAVHHAHLKGIIHRDLKPGNVLVGSDCRPRVIDFGVATSTGSAATLATHIGSLTPDGAIVGTLAYMSPEQFESASDVDARTDIYALGVMLYELCTGSLPYNLGTTPAQAMRAIALDPPLDPVRIAPAERALRGDLAAIILKAIDRLPNKRYESCAEFAADMRRWLAREPVIARRPRLIERTTRAMRRRPVLSTAIILASVGTLGVTVASLIGARYAYLEAMRAQRYITGMLIAFESETVTARGEDARISDAADALVSALDSKTFSPTEEPDMRMVAGRMYELIGLHESACAQYKLAVDARTTIHGPTSSETLEAVSSLARALMYARQKRDSSDGISGLAAPDATVAQSFALLSANLGWSDPRTLDALSWSAPSLDAGALRDAMRGINRANLSDPARAGASCVVLRALLLRAQFGSSDEDRALLATTVAQCELVLQQLKPHVLEDIGLLTRTLLYKNHRDLANRLIDAAVAFLRNPEAPREDWFYQRTVAWAAHLAGRSDIAIELYERNRATLSVIPAASRASFEEVALCITHAELAQVRLAQHDCSRVRDELSPWLTSDDAVCPTSARPWKATVFSALARACAACGACNEAQAIAERARQLLSASEGHATPRRIVEEDIAAVEQLCALRLSPEATTNTQ